MRMNRMNSLFATALAVILGAALPPAVMAGDTYEKEINVESGGKIELELKYGGSVLAEGWDRDVVRIECEDSRFGIDHFDFEIEVKNNKFLRFKAHPEDEEAIRGNNLKINLMVPRKFSIEMHSGGGRIRITGVEGKFEGSTGGGGIQLRDLKGEVKLTTGGGKIDIRDSELDGRVTTGGGEALVRDVVGNVVVKSGGGIVSYENVRGRDGKKRMPAGLKMHADHTLSDGTVVHKTVGGSIDLSGAPEGAIVQTGGGSIVLRDVERFVEATTGGGSIDIEILNGSVRAQTGAGNIEVEVIGGLGDGEEGVYLITGSGNIILTLPGDISAELDIDLAFTRNSSRDFQIKSQFDIEVELTDEWETGHGTPRKHVYGTGKLGGGGPKISIRCVNGNIRLKKGD